MTNAKTTKRALWMSVLSLLLCFTMLLGTTYAWFTDSVASANNVIKSGNLDIELEYWNGEKWVDVKDKSDILTNTLWEPGVTEVAYLRVANAGSLALKYQLGINIVSETEGVNVAGAPFKLSDYIYFGVVENVNGQTDAYANREAAVAAVTGAKKISAGYTKAESMIADQELYLALVVYMPTTVGNEANHNGTNVPRIDLGINVIATQLASESDSFDENYDKDVELKMATSSTVIAPDADTVVTLKKVDAFLDAATINVPKDAAKVDGASAIGVTVTAREDAAEGLAIRNSQGFHAYDIAVEGLAADNTVPVEVTLQLAKGLSDVKLYHYDEEIVCEYNAETGILEFATTDFSPYTVVFDNSWDGTVDTTWYNETDTTFVLTDPAQLAGVSALAASGNTFAKKTIVLGADMYLGGKKWTPISNFGGTFDGNGHSINEFTLEASTARAALFLKVYGATVKDLTLSDIKATVAKNQRVAALTASYQLSNINNVTVKNFEVTTTGASTWIAGLACSGYVNSEVTMNDCTVENFTVNDAYGAQFIAGITAVMQRNGTEADGTNVLNNLHVKSFVVNVNGIVANGSSTAVGGLLGQTQSVWQNPHFKNCSVTGLDVTATGRVDVGGFMAHPGSYTYATNCSVEGKIDVTGVTAASNYAGGFFGDYGWGDNVSKGDHKVTNCTADVDITTNLATAGGFVGSGINTENRNKNITFTNCEAKGTVTVVEGGTAVIGGFVGYTDRGIYMNCVAAQAPFIGQVADGYTLTDDGNGTLTVAK